MKDLFAKFGLNRIIGGRLPSAGQLAMQSWRLYLDNFRSLARLSFLTLLAAPLMTLAAVVNPGPLATILTVVAGAVFVLLSALTRAALICQIDSNIGRASLAGRRCLTRSKKVFWPYLLTTVALGLIIAAGYALWVLPGLVATVFLIFTEQALILEGGRGIEPFKRSIELTVGHFLSLTWRIVIVGFLFELAPFCISVLLVKFPLWLAPRAADGSLSFLWWIYLPLMTLAITALFTPLFLAAQGILYSAAKRLQEKA